MQGELQILESNGPFLPEEYAELTTKFPKPVHKIHSFSQDTLLNTPSSGTTAENQASKLFLEQVDINDLEDSDVDDEMPQNKSGRRKIKIEYLQDKIKRHVHSANEREGS